MMIISISNIAGSGVTEYTVHTQSNSLTNLLLNLKAVFKPITAELCI